jgi:isoleucyl-tRNA synthetase
MRFVLDTFAKMLAPFMPFLAEVVYQQVDGGFLGREDRASVHLEDWPEADEVDHAAIEAMGEVRAIVSRALDRREEAGRPVKQVLSRMSVTTSSGDMSEDLQQVIAEEVNVKFVSVQKGELAVDLDLELTEELIREGLVREVTRRVNQLRKETGLTIQDAIDLKIWSGEGQVRLMFDEHADAIKEGTLASSVEFAKPETEHTAEFRAHEYDFWIGF